MPPSLRVLFLGSLMVGAPLRAVYAPVPDRAPEKDLTLSLRAALSHDSNLFGAATGETDSAIWTVAPFVGYRTALTPQTFLVTSYELTLDRFDQRPGDKLLDSHQAIVRLEHSFSRATALDVRDEFSISRNPASLLAGVPLNPDQSLKRNQLDGRFITPLGRRMTATAKARSVYFAYKNPILATSLDRTENLFGVSGDYRLLPEIKAVAEYRHQEVSYRTFGHTKDKSSDFLMGGADYAVARKLSVSARLGAEWRRRATERDTTSPYAEVSAKYDYASRSFIAGGYAYTFEETADIARFTDTKVQRLFVNAQHAVTALIVASGSFTYESGTLQGRRRVADVDERTLRAGAALSYLPTKNWSVTGSIDHDRVRSDEPGRRMTRNRMSLGATFSF
ncbi:MAG: outer membrane beta-barrel protein [Opitutaceae bacterium]